MKHLKKILVADDDRAVRRAVKAALGADYAVLEARNGNEALGVLQKSAGDIAVALVDVDMPVMNGWELLAACAADATLGRVPVIALTSEKTPDVELRLLEQGIIEIIEKPFDISVLRLRAELFISFASGGCQYGDPIQRQLMELVNNGISGGIISTYLDPGSPIRFISESFVAHLGYESYTELAQAIANMWDSAIYPEDRDGALANVAGELAPDDEYVMEYRVMRRDGSIIWIRENGRVTVQGDGRKAVVGLCIDVTNLVELRDEIAQATRDLAQLTDAVRGGLCRLACDGPLTIRYANEFFYNLSGYTEKTAEAVGFTSLSFVVPEQDMRELRSSLDSELSRGTGGNFEIETRARTIDGKYIWVLGRCSYSPENGGEISAVVVDITARREMEEQLRLSEKQYRIAAQHSEKLLFRYDIKERTLRSYFDSMAENGVPQVLENVPDSFVESGVLLPESAAEYLQLYQRIAAGETEGAAQIRMYNGLHEPRWYDVKFTDIFSGSGEPLQAVMSMQDVTERKERELAYEKLVHTVEEAPDDRSVYYMMDLTANACLKENGRAAEGILEMYGQAYSAAIDSCAQNLIYYEDIQSYSAFMDRERLISCYYKGVSEAEMDFRAVGPAGEPRWRHAFVKLAQSQGSPHVIGFFTFRDIDEQKREEMLLRMRSREDALTNVLNRATFIESVNELLRQGKGAQHAFVMIDLDGFKAVNDTLGHAMGDRVLIEIAKSLKSLLRAGDLLGRLGGDEFMLCLKNIPYDDVIEKRAALICRLIYKHIAQSVTVSGSLGISLFPRDGESFEKLYEKADIALYEAKRLGRNRYIFFRPELSSGEWTPGSTPIDEVFFTGSDSGDSRMQEIVSQNSLLLQRQNEDERYRLIIEQSNTVVFEWNSEQHTFYGSEGFFEYDLSRYQPEELIKAMGGEDTAHPDDRELLRSTYQRVYDGEKHIETTLRLQKTGGSMAWCRISIICDHAENGRLRRVVGTINELDVAQEQARIQLQAISEYMAGGVLLTELLPDRRLKLIYMSPSYRRSTQNAETELYRESDDLMQLVHPDDRANMMKAIADAVDRGKVADVLYRAIGAGGTLLGWRHVRAGRIPYDESDNPVFISVISDVSELRETTERLQAILDNAPLGIGLYEVEGRRLKPVFVSAGLKGMMPAGTAYSGDIERFVHPEDIGGLVREIAEVVNTGRPGECVFRSRPEPDSRYLLARGVLMETMDAKPMILVLITDISEQRKLELQNRLGQEQMRLAFELSAAAAYEIDIENDRLIRSAAAVSKYGSEPVSELSGMPESYIRLAVHPDSAEDFREFYRGIKAGRSSGDCLMKLLGANGEYNLARTSYRCVFDDRGAPYRAVGITEDAENVADARFRFEQEDRIYRLIKHDVSCTVKVNISKNLVDRIWIRGMSDELMGTIKTHTENCRHWFSVVPNDEERAMLQRKFSLEAMKSAFAAGTEWLCAEFRRREPDGRLMWMENTARLLVNPYDGDLYGFFYQRDIDVRKKWELRLSVSVKRDPILAVYDRETMKAMTNSVLELKRDSGELCALAVFRITNYATLAGQFGQKSAEGILRSLERKIKSVLRCKHLIGSGEDGVAVLFTDISSEKWVKSKCDELMRLIGDPSLASMAAEQYAEYESAVAADRTSAASYDSLMERVKALLTGKSPSDAAVIAVPPADVTGAADPETGDIFLRALYALQTGRDSDTAYRSMLHLASVYYDCDRISLYELRENRQAAIISEYLIHNAVSRRQLNAWFDLSGTPMLHEVYEKRQALFAEDPDKAKAAGYTSTYASMLKFGVKTIIAAPVADDDAVRGFITVDNARKHQGSAALVNMLSRFIAAEFVRRGRDRAADGPRMDRITGVKDRSEYMDYAAAVAPEALSSLGAAMVDVMGLRGVNRRYGYQYGDEMLRRIADTLTGSFRRGEVYRYSGGTFLVLSPDCGRDDFEERMAKAVGQVEREYPNLVAVGRTWTDTVKSVELVMTHTEELLIAAKRERRDRGTTGADAAAEKTLRELQCAINEGRVFAYLQPKVRIADNGIHGAEALVRMRDASGELLTPGRFVPLLENMGLIRHVDLYVLDQTAKLIARWRREGREPVPISVNFSRSTMLEPGIVDTLTAAADRYGVPHRYIEIEITEGLGDMERSIVTDIGRRILNAGFGLSLDDFGSEYSNLSILSTMEFTAVKLDKSIVDGITANSRSATVVAAMTELCGRLNIAMVAEGVETGEQLELLRELGCGIAQGYLFNKPIPIEDFDRLYMK